MKNWDEYDDISENEDNVLINDIQSHQIILNEAKKLIFIRKYSKYNINNNALEKIMKECNYDDKYIINKINNYLIKNCKKSIIKKIIIIDLKNIIKTNIIIKN